MHYCYSKCSYVSCPRCKIGTIEESNYCTDDGDVGNEWRCNNCNIHYYGDDLKIFSLIILYEPSDEFGRKFVKWSMEWHLNEGYCESHMWPNGKAHFIKLPLLPLNISIERFEKLLCLI
jgi:hypothetical protein